MRGSFFKIIMFVLLTFCFLFSPMFLALSSNGVAHAKRPAGIPPGPPPGISPGPPPHAHSPEPATWLLIGSGAAGLVLLRKKLKK
jgi:hypothetical protein